MKAKKVDVIDLSSFLINYSIKNEIELNHLKLQKLLYYIQAWHLVYFEKQNIFDDLPEAWVNGPVYRRVYDEFKNWRMYDEFCIKDECKNKFDDYFTQSKEKLELTEEQWKYLDSILTHYSTMSHERLVYLTHLEDPWNNARKGIEPFTYSNQIISEEDMFNYYSKLLKNKN
jgi:uncharacterized phage-associated protein